jgi:hypothetical protein
MVHSSWRRTRNDCWHGALGSAPFGSGRNQTNAYLLKTQQRLFVKDSKHSEQLDRTTLVVGATSSRVSQRNGMELFPTSLRQNT